MDEKLHSACTQTQGPGMDEGILFTIGFTKKSAESFFTMLERSGIRAIIDVRLQNTSHLAGFTKKEDLIFFLNRIIKCEYMHRPEWAPTAALLDAYKKKEIAWGDYASQFDQLLQERFARKDFSIQALDRTCLLCSEVTADCCHRRLVAEWLQRQLPGLVVQHL